jgi:pimeloyl-ACP methyl ester carboxylesterase
MLPRPWLGPADASTCQPLAAAADEPLLLVSYRLPDCRRGALDWTFFRSEQTQFGVADSQRATNLVDEDSWWKQLKLRAGPQRTAPVIFIHGYFNSEDDAVARALGVRALLCPRETRLNEIPECTPARPVIALSWPSYHNAAKYTWDEANSEWAIDRAADMIVKIAHQYPGTILVAHSMGNRILVAAALAAKRQGVDLGRLVLGSPDVDRGELAALLDRKPDGLGFPATIYASRKDQALSGSWRTHGYARAGDLSNWVSGRQPGYPYREFYNAEILDTTNVKADFAEHRAFIASQEGAADLCHVLANDSAKPGRDPDERFPSYFVLREGVSAADPCALRAWAAVQIANKRPQLVTHPRRQ